MRAPTVLGPVLALLLTLTACGDDDGTDEGAAMSTTAPGATTTSAPDDEVECPTTVDADEFADAGELEALLAEFNEFGLRSPGSEANEASTDWLAEQLAAVPGMEVAFDEYEIDAWQPTPAGDVEPGGELAAAAAVRVLGPAPAELPVAGAVPSSEPTGEQGVRGPLVAIPPDVPITAENAAGKVVVREVPPGGIPYAAFTAIDHHLTDDIPTDGDYDRPFLRAIDPTLVDAGLAGAAAVILVWDAPTDQVAGMWAPHTGTRTHVPAVFAGSDQAATLADLAARGETVEVVVRAAWGRATTRNLIATLPGQSRERIVFNTNHDSATWVQENGTVALVALARYLGSLPIECRARDVVFALTASHLAFTNDGTFRYGPELDEDFDDGTVAFVLVLEHLGTNEILPGADGRLAFTGEHELFAWSAPAESPVLVQASVDAVQRRGLDRTAVLQGVGAPVDGQVPAICSQGGLGSNFHPLLVPTIAGISGPWSMFAPAFAADAIDFEHLRNQALAFGDIALQLDDVPVDEIAGDYLAARQRRTDGAPTCTVNHPPAVAPTP